MRWDIPAKTFLVGEYAALTGGSALILCTTPCFTFRLTDDAQVKGIHPHSPAGRLWQEKSKGKEGIEWIDPYQGQGGLGASSAQFLGAYLATCYLSSSTPSLSDLLTSYHEYSWQGIGVRPSGYDVLAQSQRTCVYLNQEQQHYELHAWPFEDIDFILVRTGHKLATHEHLCDLNVSSSRARELSLIADEAKMAFEIADSERLVRAIITYQQQLISYKLTLSSTINTLSTLAKNPLVLAAKGCGALGADVLLLIVKKEALFQCQYELTALGFVFLASSQALYQGAFLIKK